MFARGAQWNVSIFRPEGLLNVYEVMREYLKLAILYDMPYHNAKFTLLQMQLPEDDRIEFTGRIVSCRTLEQIWYLLFAYFSALFDMSEYYEATVKARLDKVNESI